MKILHLQYVSSVSGNYTKTLHDLMVKNGIKSKILSLQKNKKLIDDNIFEVDGILPKIKSTVDINLQSFWNRGINSNFGGFTFPILGTDISRNKHVKESDFIYIHWALGGFLNIASWSALAKLNKPIIFVLHDMFTFTGGCHYSFDCEKFVTKCEKCQILNSSEIIDRAQLLFNKKSKFFREFDNLYFIAPSIWMQNMAKRSNLLIGKQINHIYNSVSPNFKKLEGSNFRKENNIHEEKKIIGFGANYVNSPYKGFQYLLAALKLLGQRKENCLWEVLVFGGDLSSDIIEQIPFKVHYTGYLGSEEEICQAYNAMDVFVLSSIADNLPTTVLESLKCGTPVVGFYTGGVPEMIKHLKNGYLAEKYDVKQLSEGIEYCIDNQLNGYLTSEFSCENIIENHIKTLKLIERNVEKRL